MKQSTKRISGKFTNGGGSRRQLAAEVEQVLATLERAPRSGSGRHVRPQIVADELESLGDSAKCELLDYAVAEANQGESLYEQLTSPPVGQEDLNLEERLRRAILTQKIRIAGNGPRIKTLRLIDIFKSLDGKRFAHEFITAYGGEEVLEATLADLNEAKRAAQRKDNHRLQREAKYLLETRRLLQKAGLKRIEDLNAVRLGTSPHKGNLSDPTPEAETILNDWDVSAREFREVRDLAVDLKEYANFIRQHPGDASRIDGILKKMGFDSIAEFADLLQRRDKGPDRRDRYRDVRAHVEEAGGLVEVLGIDAVPPELRDSESNTVDIAE